MATGKWLIVTDLDDTLVGPCPEDREALRQLNRHLQPPEIVLVYATGRSPASAQALIAEAGLLAPAALISGVDTAISYEQSPEQADQDWWQRLKVNWDMALIDKIALGHADSLIPQPAGEQNPFKRSFFLAPEQAKTVISTLRAQLAAAGIEAQIVYSSDRDLDILPIGAGKGQAVRHLQERWGFTASTTVVCGDSGNDQGLFETGSLGIAVGNARAELVRWLDINEHLPIYRARQRCAAGLLEGLQHWQVL